MPDHPQLIRPLLRVLDQGARLVAGLDAEAYTRCPEPLATAGVGAHMRHCLDFVKALVNGVPEKRIDYDAREREPDIETDPDVALARLQDLRARVASLDEAMREGRLDPRLDLLVRMDAPEDAPADGSWTRSSLGRELSLVMSHTVHHYALIAMTLRHLGIDPGPDFGVAPSTLAYWKEEGRCAPQLG